MKQKIEETLQFCQKYLPHQGPLEFFVHHNTLHALENLNFFDALKNAKRLYRSDTSKDISWFQSKYKNSRISDYDLDKIFDQNDLKKNYKLPNGKILNLESLILKLLHYNYLQNEDLLSMAEIKLIKEIHFDNSIESSFKPIYTISDVAFKNENEREFFELEVEYFLTKFFATYFDKGISYWHLKTLKLNILETFSLIHKKAFNSKWEKDLQIILKYLDTHSMNNEQIIEYCLSKLAIPELLLNNFIYQTLYKLKGWTALVLSLEQQDHENQLGHIVDFKNYTAVILIVELAVYNYLKKDLDLSYFDYRYKRDSKRDFEKRSVRVLSQFLKNEYQLQADEILEFSKNENFHIIEQYLNEYQLLKLWQEAYENSVLENTVEVISHNIKLNKAEQKKPKYQAVFCIDDREESLRRHLEEIEPSIETFGYAGHFGLNIMYQGVRDIYPRPLCPLSANPEFFVYEKLKNEADHFSFWGKIESFFIHQHQRVFYGFFISIIFGLFSLVPFALDILAPGLSLKLKKYLENRFLGKEEFGVFDYESSPERSKKGYELSELTDVVFNMLTTISLTTNFSDLIYICGHGSQSLNNPHNAAYDCGACAGGKGIPNGRLFSIIANRKDVREELKLRGIEIPDTTIFVGGYHDTCNDRLFFFEDDLETNQLQLKSDSHQQDFSHFKKILTEVSLRDAGERARKFQNINLKINKYKKLKAIEQRVYNLAQPRPEYGHSTNAICHIGPRKDTRDIFFDRRSFLISYDFSKDENLATLKPLLNSVIGVCAGINLEYYFAYVGNEVFGAGTKLPHNVTSLMGVMSGYKGDLRLGLPWEMVEIHEPMRLTTVLELTREKFSQLIEQLNESTKNIIKNEWIRLILQDQNAFYLFKNNQFMEINLTEKSYKFSSSSNDIYKNKREILDFSFIGKQNG